MPELLRRRAEVDVSCPAVGLPLVPREDFVLTRVHGSVIVVVGVFVERVGERIVGGLMCEGDGHRACRLIGQHGCLCFTTRKTCSSSTDNS